MIHLLNDLVQLLYALLHHLIFVYYHMFVTVCVNDVFVVFVVYIFHLDSGFILQLQLWQKGTVVFFIRIGLQGLARDLIEHVVLLLFFVSHKSVKFLQVCLNLL